MTDVIVREFGEPDRAAVVELWRGCGLLRPWNDPDLDIDRKLAVDDSMFLVAAIGNVVVGSLMAGYDGHRGWINYLAVDPARHRSGIGRLLMHHAEQRLADAGCPKINLQIRIDNSGAAAFYERLGFATDDAISMGKRLVVDTAPVR